MADFSVDYTETGTLRDNVASLRDQLASLQRIGTLTREEAGFAGIASMVEECDGTLTDCVTTLAEVFAALSVFLESVELHVKETDNCLSLVISDKNWMSQPFQ